ncbi:MAG: ABC transporter permease [Candidatus Eisenbacteria bacterium]|nr:ABC transporter permease [Candidatus Eisenbacteria bacterium]
MAAIPLVYNLRSLKQRPLSTAATAIGLGLVVAVFIAMMALAEGFQAALTTTGAPDNALILRKGADGEMSSGISREIASSIAASPFIARDAQGQPLVSNEVYVVLSLPRLGVGMANVVARGVSPQAFEVRKGIKIVEGRRPQSGSPEILVGRAIVSRFAHCRVGDKLSFAKRQWTVVGHFSADGSSFESEIWGENEQFAPAFDREGGFQSVTFRLANPEAFPAVQKALQDDPRYQVDAYREADFYKRQSAMLATVLRFVAIFITAVMAIGAVFGAINTMYAAVATRGPEIAVLLTLGFKPGSVLLSFMLESLLIALIGGLIGCALALPINGIVTSTTNWSSFSEIAFAFRVTPALLTAGMLFALGMGLIGGFFPARRAARANVIETIRQG